MTDSKKTRTISNKKEAREWLDETLSMKGNRHLTAEQAKALDAFADKLAELLNVLDVHPVYMLGVLETMKLQVYEFAKESVERAVEMAGGLDGR